MAKTWEDACAASTKTTKTPKTNQRTDMIRLPNTLLSVFFWFTGGNQAVHHSFFNPVFFSSQPDWNRAFLTEEIPGVICLSLSSHTAQRGSMPAAGAGPRQLKEVKKHTTTTGWARASSPLPPLFRGGTPRRVPTPLRQSTVRLIREKSPLLESLCEGNGGAGTRGTTDSFGTAWSSAFAK